MSYYDTEIPEEGFCNRGLYPGASTRCELPAGHESVYHGTEDGSMMWTDTYPLPPRPVVIHYAGGPMHEGLRDNDAGVMDRNLVNCPICLGLSEPDETVPE